MSDVESPQESGGVRLLRTPWAWGALACCVLFLAQGLAVLPYPGIQNDEALFAGGIYAPRWEISSVRVAGHTVPLMLMTYIGAVKSLLYVPILKVFGPTVYAIRVPMLLAGAATVWLLFVLMARLAGPAIALFSAALLATDPTFLLCTTFDWGPVAIQVLLFTGALVLLIRHVQQPSRLSLPIAAFLAGLALWNKAVFVWSLVGFVLAILIVFRRRIVPALRLKAVALAVCALMLGALPLIAYNVRNRGVTVTENVQVTTGVAWRKLGILRATLDGSVLFGYIVNMSPTASARPGTQSAALGHRLATALATPRHTLFPLAIAGSVLLLPFLWRSPVRDPALVALLFCVLQYLQMFWTAGTGTSAHHVVLLDPAPHAFVALCVGGVVRRLRRLAGVLLAGVSAVLVGSNLLVTAAYLALFSLGGSPPIWTDAITPLAAALARSAARQVVVMDWGILGSLRLLSGGHLPLVMGSDLLVSDPVSGETEDRLVGWLTDRD